MYDHSCTALHCLMARTFALESQQQPLSFVHSSSLIPRYPKETKPLQIGIEHQYELLRLLYYKLCNLPQSILSPLGSQSCPKVNPINKNRAVKDSPNILPLVSCDVVRQVVGSLFIPYSSSAAGSATHLLHLYSTSA